MARLLNQFDREWRVWIKDADVLETLRTGDRDAFDELVYQKIWGDPDFAAKWTKILDDAIEIEVGKAGGGTGSSVSQTQNIVNP